MQGKELNNNAVMSYRNAILVMTDEMIIDHNVLVIPGIRESLITDYAARRVRDYGKAIYLMDIPHYTKDSERIFVSSRGNATGTADVDLTSAIFDQRELDSSYVATYFPDVMIKDSGDDENARQTNHRAKRVPSSVVALGALARTDAIQSPWFAPAGFSRGALPNVTSLDVRLNAADRDTLYEARINPIANFPNNQFVIFGQKTTQIARTALDRVNVRRLMINIKRRIQKVAQGLLFEQNDAATRNRFISRTSSILADVRVRQGIEDFRVIMDDTNNTAEDVDNNRLNGRIVVVPTRAVEFIAMDFVITNSGVEFP
jgi:phage tail sheath protein FI